MILLYSMRAPLISYRYRGAHTLGICSHPSCDGLTLWAYCSHPSTRVRWALHTRPDSFSASHWALNSCQEPSNWRRLHGHGCRPRCCNSALYARPVWLNKWRRGLAAQRRCRYARFLSIQLRSFIESNFACTKEVVMYMMVYLFCNGPKCIIIDI